MFDYNLSKVIITFVIAFLVALAVTPLSIRIANRFGIIDKPRDDRRIHDRPIPRFGGLGIFTGAMIGLATIAGAHPLIIKAMLGGALMYLLGVIDDVRNLRPVIKFAGQWAIATLMYVMGIRITFISNMFGIFGDAQIKLVLSSGLAYLLTIIWLVGITNAVNLMDGMDGLAAGSTAIMAMSMAYVAYIHGTRLGSMTVCFGLMAVAGACFGFLPYNFSPAKTFMGDGGALFLGYIIAVMSVISPLKRATMVSAVIPILTLAVPIFDTIYAMLRRIAKRESIMKADKGHLHHHLLASGYGQRRSVLIMYGIVGIMGIVAVEISRGLYKDAFFLAMIALLYLLIIIVPKRPEKKLKQIITNEYTDEDE